jgi:hypothetical protein
MQTEKPREGDRTPQKASVFKPFRRHAFIIILKKVTVAVKAARKHE